MRRAFSLPCYIPEEKEAEYEVGARTGKASVCYVPEGFSADDVVQGRIPQEAESENDLPALTPEVAPKPKGKKRGK